MEYSVGISPEGGFYCNGRDMSDISCLKTTLYPENTPIMQCTGLRDKNGQLIYEGDILKLLDENRGNTVGDVYYGSGAFHVRNVDCLWFGSKHGVCEDYTLIGNLYQNSELLLPKPRNYCPECGIEMIKHDKIFLSNPPQIRFDCPKCKYFVYSVLDLFP